MTACRKAISRRSRTKGYTLVEMLVVVGIIAVILGLSANTMKNLATAEGVRAGVPVIKAKFEEARQLAKSSGRNIRVVIYADSEKARDSAEETERFLRYVAIAHYVDNNGDPVTGDYTTTSGRWELISTGELLPNKCYYDRERSLTDKDGNTYASYISTSQADTASLVAKGSCNVYLPNENSPTVFAFYEFNGAGFPTNPLATLETQGNTKKPPRIILSNGQIRRVSGEVVLRQNPAGDRNYAGFIMTRHGELMDYEDLDDIDDED